MEKVRKINPSHLPSWKLKAEIYKDLNEFEQALKCYNTILKLEPEDKKTLEKLEELKRKDQKNYATEEKEQPKYDVSFLFEKIVSDIADWEELGKLLINERKFYEAINLFDEVIQENPDLDIPWAYKGEALAYLKRPHEAVQSFDKALELNPLKAKTWWMKGKCMNTQQKALECYQEAAKLEPKIWLVNLAIIHSNSKRFNEALECINKALDLNSENEPIKIIKWVILCGLEYGKNFYAPVANSLLCTIIPRTTPILYTTKMKLSWTTVVAFSRYPKRRKLDTEVFFTNGGIACFFPISKNVNMQDLNSFRPRFIPYMNIAEPSLDLRFSSLINNMVFGEFRFKLVRNPTYESQQDFKKRSKLFKTIIQQYMP